MVDFPLGTQTNNHSLSKSRYNPDDTPLKSIVIPRKQIISVEIFCSFQWPFQDPRLEVPTIYKAYISGLCKGISLQNMALYGTVPPFKDPEIPIDVC